MAVKAAVKAKVRRGILFAAVAGVLLLFYALRAKEEPQLKIGHGGGNLVAALYLASEGSDWVKNFDAIKFGSTSDTGYALLAGGLEAGFIEVEKVKSLQKLPGFENLTGVGRITFPYGATMVLRKGLNLRLRELNGITIAVSSPECVLLAAFKKDAERLKADISGVTWKVMPFDTMIPALEAKVADAAILKGASAVVALHAGHSILYQNWDVQPGDECCPAIVDQAAQVLLVRREFREKAEVLVERLLTAETQGRDALRAAIARHTSIPPELLEGQPVAEFNRADDSLVALLTEFLDEEGNRIDPDEIDPDEEAEEAEEEERNGDDAS
ncbi:MAG: hypothetical protein LBP21_00580 [Synergistaceae bacterium]|jgi:ABC-type nitrate/sulfonate/bicarbonate transport system substrate-binding protein|nr:hypothetical protein [Synergistaceae bacterium]